MPFKLNSSDISAIVLSHKNRLLLFVGKSGMVSQGPKDYEGDSIGMSELVDAIVKLKEDAVLEIIRCRVEAGEEPMPLVEECRRGVTIVGERFQKGEYFLSELIMSAEIFKQVMRLIEPRLSGDLKTEIVGRIVLGSVKGDIHNIGKDIVGNLLQISGFEVFDVGVDVAPQVFVAKLLETGASILGLSGLITPSFESMKETIKAIEEKGMRDKVKVIIGGGVIIEQVRDYVGADAFTRDAMEGVSICQNFMKEAKK